MTSPIGAADAGDAGADGSAPLGPCATSADCGPDASCYFALGSCSAKGQCFPNPSPSTPRCNLIEIVCGCGMVQSTGCGFPNGYASGPAIGPCAEDAGPSPPTPEAGPPKPEAGTPIGPCGKGETCPEGAGCFYPIGSCSSQPVCVVKPSTGGTCGAVEGVCGCGEKAATGCGFPEGYASGPTTGATVCP